MSNEIYNNVLSRLALEVPLFAQTILDKAIINIGATPETVTAIELKIILEKYVEPAIRNKLGKNKGLAELGSGIVYMDNSGKITHARGLGTKVSSKIFTIQKEVSSENISLGKRDVKVTVIPNYTVDGSRTGATGLVTDVTLNNNLDKDMLQNYEDLAQSEKKYEEMANAIDDVLWICDWKTKKVTYASRSYEKVWGRSLSKLIGSADEWAKAILPEFQKSAYEHFMNLGKGKSYEQEYKISRSDGKEVWIRDRGFPIKNSDGDVIRIVGVAQDITDRKENENRVKNVLDNVMAGIMLIDANNHKIEYINPYGEKLVGMNGRDICGKLCYELVCSARKGACPITDLKKDLDCSENSLINSKKEQIPILKSVKIIDVAGKRLLVESFVDIRGKKRTEEELRKQMDILERFKDATVDQILQLKKIEEENKKLKEQMKKLKAVKK